jgi:UDP-N-acetylglucosamine 1-carboxyvinyltransferase
MSRFIIHGQQPLQGTVKPSGNKNAALPLLAATLLTAEPVTLHNVPAIGDVGTMIQLLQGLGVTAERTDAHTVTLCARDLRGKLDGELFRIIRGSITLAGPLLARLGRAELPMPGGDKIGRRRIDTHLLALSALGAAVEHDAQFRLTTPGLRGADILLDEASVTATENAVMAASLARGRSMIRNAASEPHVQDLCNCLVRMGAQIEGIGSNTLCITGVDALHGCEFTISPDLTEIGSYIGLGAVTQGEIRVQGVPADQMRMVELVFCDRLGVRMHLEPTATGHDLVISAQQDLAIRADIGGAVPKIDDAPWPAFPADLMSIALVVATQARGTVLMHEKMFESRLYFVDKLITMGAQIILCDPHRAVVVGPAPLHGQELSSPDIRAGMALLIAALAAHGESQIANVQQIDRGYERVEEKLRSLGAQITRVDD